MVSLLVSQLDSPNWQGSFCYLTFWNRLGPMEVIVTSSELTPEVTGANPVGSTNVSGPAYPLTLDHSIEGGFGLLKVIKEPTRAALNTSDSSRGNKFYGLNK